MDGELDGAQAAGAEGSSQDQAQAGRVGEGAPAVPAPPTAPGKPEGEGAVEGYQAAIAERDARIAELEGQVAEAARTAESAETLRAEIAELKRSGEEQRVAFELAMAGCRNAKAAAALLPDHGGDVAKLKEAEPWLFAQAEPPKPSGRTGLPNAGAAFDEGAQLKRWRAIAGLDDEE